MMKSRFMAIAAASLAASFIAPASHSAEGGDIGTLTPEKADKAFAGKPVYSPYAGRNFPTRPLFGDTHLHTGASFDAGAFGARLTPRDAYRFARGEEVMIVAAEALCLRFHDGAVLDRVGDPD